MTQVPTVKIKTDNGKGFIIINESDFDSKIHTKFTETKKPVQRRKSKSIK